MAFSTASSCAPSWSSASRAATAVEAESAAGSVCAEAEAEAGASDVPESPLDQLPVMNGLRLTASGGVEVGMVVVVVVVADGAPELGLVEDSATAEGAAAVEDTLQGNTWMKVASSSSRNEARKKSCTRIHNC